MNTLFVSTVVMPLGLPVVRRLQYTGVGCRQQACVDRIAGANMLQVRWIIDYGVRNSFGGGGGWRRFFLGYI